MYKLLRAENFALQPEENKGDKRRDTLRRCEAETKFHTLGCSSFLQTRVPAHTFCVALEGLCAQMGDAVTLEVLRPGEGFPTTLHCTDKTTVIVVFPGEHMGHGDQRDTDIMGPMEG